MLELLTLKNIVLVEHLEIAFGPGMTVITGESGAGKTALITALHLLLGQRVDNTKIRKGADEALVRAVFSLKRMPALQSHFSEAGLTFPPDGESLIISRILTRSGKSRALIGTETVPSAFLQKIAPQLFDFVGQHAHVAMRSPAHLLSLLDAFSGISLAPFQEAWRREKDARSLLRQLQEKERKGTEKRQQLTSEIEELEAAKVLDGEGEEVYREYALLSNSQQLLAKSDEMLSRTEESISHCARLDALTCEMEQCGIDPSPMGQPAKEAHIHLEELLSQIQSFAASLSPDPNRLTYLEERLGVIDRLEKRFGNHLSAYLLQAKEELASIGSIEEKRAEAEQALTKAEREVASEAWALRKERKTGAESLSRSLSVLLRDLSISAAEVSIEFQAASRSNTGEDEVHFYLKANVGEASSNVSETTSGGELARLLFALKVLLAAKTRPEIQIFDEIDANVGGKAAAVIGEKLSSLAKDSQVICITHFPQVAKWADHHFCVAKRLSSGRTVAKVKLLSPKEREEELLRMVGGEELVLSSSKI